MFQRGLPLLCLLGFLTQGAHGAGIADVCWETIFDLPERPCNNAEGKYAPFDPPNTIPMPDNLSYIPTCFKNDITTATITPEDETHPVRCISDSEQIGYAYCAEHLTFQQAVDFCANFRGDPAKPETMNMAVYDFRLPESPLEAGRLCGSGCSYDFDQIWVGFGATAAPTSTPTKTPTDAPTTKAPTGVPTTAPTTKSPTKTPTASPTGGTATPTKTPTSSPTTKAPTGVPTSAPTTKAPTKTPTASPTATPELTSATYNVGDASPAFSPNNFNYILELVHGEETTDLAMTWDGDIVTRAVYLHTQTGAETQICNNCPEFEAQTVNNLVDNDKIRVFATKPNGIVDTYTWTLVIPEPELVNVDYNPGDQSPSFNKAQFDYILTLDTGATSTTKRVTKTPGVLDTTIVHRSQASNADLTICEECSYDVDYDVNNLVHDDQIITTVRYSVLGVVTSTTVYTWTLRIPTPELTNAGYNPGAGQPSFNSEVFDYIVDMPVGTTETETTLSKDQTEGELHARVVHKSQAHNGDVEICDGCDFEQPLLISDLVHDDQVVAVVSYKVDGFVVNEKTYTWTFRIPTPELIDAQYTPGDGSPAFNSERFDYILDLPVGTRSTETAITAEVPEKLDLVIKHESQAEGTTVLICENCNFESEGGRYDVPNLVHDDKIIATVTYTVGDLVVSEKIYTWTVKIPTPTLVDAVYSPGEGDPQFRDDRFDYILTLPPGTQVTDTVISKTPGDLDLTITHESQVAGETVTICEGCDFDRAIPVDKLVGDDKIVAVVTYRVLDLIVKQDTYTWTLRIDAPHLEDAQYSPGEGSPAFDDRRFDYILDLPTGTQSTDTVITKTPGDLDLMIKHESIAQGETVTICEDCDFDRPIPVDKLVGDDKIIATVTYRVEDFIVQQDVYTWTLRIPTPHLVDAQYNPGEGSPAFDDRRFDYILDLPVGTRSTDTVISKTPGDLDLMIEHQSIAQGETVTICEDCDFDTPIPVDKLVGDDKIIATVTYRVEDHIVQQDVYTWTLNIPTPRLVDAAYSPGEASPAFQSNVYDYILDLPVGTQETDTNIKKEDGDLILDIVHRSVAIGADLPVCENCPFDTAIPVDRLVHDDKIIATVTYKVEDHVVRQDVYTWTLRIPTPQLINVDYNPGEGDPAFNAAVYEYDLHLPPGSSDTAVTLTKQPGDISTTIIKRSASDTTICTDCQYAIRDYPITGLRNNDKVVVVVTYTVGGHLVSREIYIWTLIIPFGAQKLKHCQPATNGQQCEVNQNPICTGIGAERDTDRCPEGTLYEKIQMEAGGVATCYDQFDTETIAVDDEIAFIRCYSATLNRGVQADVTAGQRAEGCQGTWDEGKEYCESLVITFNAEGNLPRTQEQLRGALINGREITDGDVVDDWRLSQNVAEAGTYCGSGCSGDFDWAWVEFNFLTASPTSPTISPTGTPTTAPTAAPTTVAPTGSPTTKSPTMEPTFAPTDALPTDSPTGSPTMSPTGSPTATTVSPTDTPTPRGATVAPTAPTAAPTAAPTPPTAGPAITGSPTVSPTGAPTAGSTQELVSTVKFSGLEMSQLEDPLFDTTFRSAYRDAVADSAGVPTQNVEIVSITPGSVNILTKILYDSLAFGTVEAMEAKSTEMTAKLINDPASIFTAPTFSQFGDVTSANTLIGASSPKDSPTAAPTPPPPTGSPTQGVITSTSTDSPTSAAPALSYAGLVSFAVLVQTVLFMIAY